jgi:hypothetical protein
MGDFSQRRGLVPLLSCPASGRPPYLEGEAAAPFFSHRPNKRAGALKDLGHRNASEDELHYEENHHDDRQHG